MTRGEVWWVDYGVPFGSEPGFRRPALVIQNDYFNASKISTTIVIPLTTNTLLADVPGNVYLAKTGTGLSKDSVAIIPQLGVIDKQRLIEKIAVVPQWVINEIEESILFILDIT
ncbi:MAG: type II toxin-antitoxin system PemK/MazF family toxin [Spirochaetaceae bacterium]|jgi:mRNA interferase MazF|nr:type II toxin-antitoxin system PemK/MazF family toxin [Spirochaetaceae bacterium]